jgi:hypothetical protein
MVIDNQPRGRPEVCLLFPWIQAFNDQESFYSLLGTAVRWLTNRRYVFLLTGVSRSRKVPQPPDGADNSGMAIDGRSWAQPDVRSFSFNQRPKCLTIGKPPHHLVKLCAAIDRNTKMMEFIVSRMMDGQPSAVTTSLSTNQDSNETVDMTGRGKSKFKGPARKTTHKVADELRYRASYIINLTLAPLTLVLQSYVRTHTKTMMGITGGSNVSPEPAPQEDILKYKSTLNNEDGPSRDRFQADFSEIRPENSPWNRRLAEVFVDDYLQKGQAFSEVKDLPRYFMTYLRTLQSARRKKTTTTASGTTTYEQASQRNRVEKRKHTVRLTPLFVYQH